MQTRPANVNDIPVLVELRKRQLTDEGEGVFNGDMGIIQSIDTREELVRVLFDDNRLVEYSFDRLEELEQGLLRALGNGGADVGAGGAGDAAPNLRQAGLLREALEDMEKLSSALDLGHPPDILDVHLAAASRALLEVTGALDSEAMLDSIFSSFCIGK